MKYRKIWKRIAACTLAGILAAGGSGLSHVQAEETGGSSTFTQLGRLRKEGNRVFYELDDPGILMPAGRFRARMAEPVKYDLRTEKRITSVKNQGADGSCWTFGAMASAESGILTQGNGSAENLDLSEEHLLYFNAYGENSDTDKSSYAGGDSFNVGDGYRAMGGGRWYSVPTLARWYGAVDEADVPYGTPLASEKQTMSRIRIENAEYLPEPVSITNASGVTIDMAAVQQIKEAIRTKGAVSVGYYASNDQQRGRDGTFWNETNRAGYYDGRKIGESRLYANHEVTLAGWDDNYSKDNFSEGCKPEKNGAWLVKNSWGTSAGDDGYFYLSYYDASFSEPTFYSMENQVYDGAGTNHTYSNIYQYDGVGSGSGEYLSDDIIKSANKYTARGLEMVKAVSSYTYEADETLTVDLYKNPTSQSDPESGEKMASVSKHFTYAGYHTMNLGEQAFKVKKGDVITAVVSGKSAEGYSLLAELRAPQESFKMDAEEGQSYLYVSGKWQTAIGYDVLGYKAGNALVKMFTDNVAEAPGIQTIAIETKDSEGIALASLNAQQGIENTLPAFTSSIHITPEPQIGSTYCVTAGDKIYQPGDWIPIGDVVKEDITVTTFNPDKTDQKEYKFTLTATTAELTFGDTKLLDANGILPQSSVLTASEIDSGESYDAVKSALEPYIGQDNFQLLSLETSYGGNPLDIGEKNVTVSFGVPAGFDGAKTSVYFYDGTGTLTAQQSVFKEGRLSVATGRINGLYALAMPKTAPPVPADLQGVYDPAKTLKDYPIPTAEGGVWNFDSLDEVPTVSNNETGYTATYTPEADSPYFSYKANIRIILEKAQPVAEEPDAAGVTYGQPLKEAAINATKAGEVTGRYEWKEPESYPVVGNSGYGVIFIPDDSENYKNAEGTSKSVPVTPKSITVSVNAAAKYYGDPLPKFGITVPDGTLVGADTAEGLGISLTSNAGELSDAGTYDVTGSASNQNYHITIDGNGKLRIDPRPVTVIPADISITYGDKIPVPGDYTIEGLVEGGTGKDDIEVNLSTDATDNSVSGNYKITGTANSISGNYLPEVKNGTLVINKRVIKEVDNQSSLPTDIADKITISGNFKDVKGLKVILKDLSQNTAAYQEIHKQLASNSNWALLYLVDITVEGAKITDQVVVQLPAGDNQEGKNMIVLHYLEKGSKDQNGNVVQDNTIEQYNVICKNGSVDIPASSLSPFALISIRDGAVPQPGGSDSLQNSHNNKTSQNVNTVETGDSANLILWMLILAAAIAAIIAVAAKRKV